MLNIATNLIRVYNGVQSMRNCQHSARSKVFSYGVLYHGVRLRVHIGSSLVQHQYAVVAHDSACQTHKLALTYAEVCTTFGNLLVESI